MNLFDKDNSILKEIVNLNYKASLVIAGGGTSTISSLLLIPGASNFILEAHIPYSKKSLERYLDCEVKTTCNTLVSIQLARTAKKRADFLNHEKKYNIGISCTSALKTNRIRVGDDRAHISIFINKKIFYKYIRLKTYTRLEQEKEISFYILNFIKETIG
ncbi:MAG: hypothetical protein VXX25_02755 [Verrucomicrobiota bacterium]|nr:hypothetical protein [Verrucomicrobiota bacterium]|tara:strand:+ start:1237 stop:1716 length:480 start_codon:yes stop_codon:yes gene_type:complete